MSGTRIVNPGNDAPHAIVIQDVLKHFKKSTVRREYTTFKSELVRMLGGNRGQPKPETRFIEALRGINLEIPRGQTVGILGRNGSGKSTLLKLITGIYTPTSGNITVNGRISALLDLGAGFHPDFSGRENILINGIILGMSRAEVKARMDDIIAFSELGEFIDEPVRTYSSGMYMRLAFAVATHVDPEILIIDEILAVGDEHFGKKSLAKMMEFKQRGKTIVLVTHDLNSVVKWCDFAAWIDGGRIRKVGTPAHVVAEYKEAIALAESHNDSFTPPALAHDGGGLPALPTRPTPSTGPQVDWNYRSGTFDVELSEVELVNRAGETPVTFDPEETLEIHGRFLAVRPPSEVHFGFRISRTDGTFLYETTTKHDGAVVPQPLPGSGRMVLRLERLGFLPAEYLVDVMVLGPDNVALDHHKGLYRFRIQTPMGDSGIARPSHRWSFTAEAASGAAPRLARIGIS